VETLDCFSTLTATHKVVPLGDEVTEGATLVTERNSAIHAPTGLASQLARLLLFVNFFEIHQSQTDGASLGKLTLLYLEESLGISHRLPP
jgi:hypothetical protein